MVPAQGRFRRQISTESCHRVSSIGRSARDLIGFIAAADTGRFKRAEDGERVGVSGALLT